MSAMDRMSCQYRTGYYHGQTQQVPTDYSGFNPVDEANSGYGANPFADHDYRQGYKAGANDDWWRRFYIANGFHNKTPEFMPAAGYVSYGRSAVGGAE